MPIETFSGLGAFQRYLAVKSHFHSDYDFFKYNGVVRVGEKAFAARKDRFFFEILEKRVPAGELTDYLVANMKGGKKPWIREIVGDPGKKAYSQWKATMDSLSYLTEDKLTNGIIMYGKKGFFTWEGGRPARIFSMLVQERMPEEVVLAADKLFGFMEGWPSDPLVDGYRRRLAKYEPFIRERLSSPGVRLAINNVVANTTIQRHKETEKCQTLTP